MGVEYVRGDLPNVDELIELYDSVGWAAYTKEPERLTAALTSSLATVTARCDGRLVGLARVIGDGHTIVYLQDILVAAGHQGAGIGRELFQRVMAPYAHVRQKVLMTDDEPGQRAFYEAMGFTEVRDLQFPIRVFAQFTSSP